MNKLSQNYTQKRSFLSLVPSLVFLLIFVFALTGCTQALSVAEPPLSETEPAVLNAPKTEAAAAETAAPAEEAELTATEEVVVEPLTVITTLFPQYDFVRSIAGDRAEVSLILPPGVEPHSFEPTPRNIVEIGSADLFIYTGDLMEPWAGRILESIENPELVVVDSSLGITLAEGKDDHAHEHEDADKHAAESEADKHANEAGEAAKDEDHKKGLDPHIWLDPILAQQMIETITDALVKADPAGEEFFRNNAAAYIAELQAFDAAAVEAFAGAERRTIVYGGHFTFGYFARRYNLEHISPYTGFAPNAEPSPRRIAELVLRMRETNSTTIFYAELVDPKVAEVISEATGAELVMLHGAHNVTSDEMDAGITFMEIKWSNLEKLREGLGIQ